MGRLKGDYINITPFFSKNLDYLIRMNNYKKFEVAEKVGVNTSNITRYINGGVKQISEDNLLNICTLFAVKKDDFLNIDLEIHYKTNNNKINEPKQNYMIEDINENDYLNIPIFLKFAKAVDQTYTNEDFYTLFRRSKNKFLDETAKKRLDMTILINMRQREVDLNSIFTENDFMTDYKSLFNLSD
jgi:DNA-binding Xre family transcriptional regulator